MSSNTNLKSQERRRFFRIDDDINLFYKIIDAKQANAPSNVASDALEGCTLSTAWHILTQEAKILHPRIEIKDPEIAEYFKLLNTKLDLIGGAFIAQETNPNDHKIRNVNLSASGVAFDNDEPLNLGEYLEVKMVLSNIVAVISLQAKVVSCKKNADHQSDKAQYLISVDYVNIKEQDRELLIQYIVQRQKQQIRAQKEALMLAL